VVLLRVPVLVLLLPLVLLVLLQLRCTPIARPADRRLESALRRLVRLRAPVIGRLPLLI
jgi:hypothetical protein